VTVTSAFEPDFDHQEGRPGFTYRRARIGWQVESKALGASVYELPPGQATFPYHWHAANEELLIVLSGRPSLRSPSGWRSLAEGEVVAFPAGEDGAHQIANRGHERATFFFLSTMIAPELTEYPDTGKVGALERAPGAPGSGGQRFFEPGDQVDYWEGEEPPIEAR
jgi:uncharacterized cupin superfamily protein